MAPGPAELLERPTPAVSREAAAAVADRLYGVAGEATPLGGERDHNFLISGRRNRLALKFAHPAEPVSVLEMQQQGLRHLARVDPDLPVPRAFPTAAGDLVATVEIGGAVLPVRAVTYLPGVLLEGRRSTGPLRRNLALLLARLDRALDGFSHPGAERDYLWDLTQVTRLRPYTVHLSADRRRLAEDLLDHLGERVLPALPHLRAQVIHSDVNPANLLVDPAAPDRLVGVIDFADLIRAPLVFDLAIAAAYQCMGEGEPGMVIAGLAGAYHSHLPLDAAEIDLLPDLATARLVQSMIISGWRVGLHPDNREYILMHAEPVWRALQILASLSPTGLIDAVRRACERVGGSRHGR